MGDPIDYWRSRWAARQVDLDREAAEPWALSLVVRVERANPPTRADALTAAATAVVRLLTDEPTDESAKDESAKDESAKEALSRWADGWIRKVVRRARGVRWAEVGDLPGVTVACGSAEVRALVPHPVAAPPAVLAKLQVAGLELPATEPPPRRRGALTIAVAPDLTLTAGKACAQVGHAAQVALLELDRVRVGVWAADGFPIDVVEGDKDAWARVLDGDAARVRDGGFTEVAPGTMTCAAAFLA